MFQTTIFAFSCIEKLLNFVEVFIFPYFIIHMLNRLATINYSLCFKKQTLELLLYLFFKAELPTNGL